MHSLLMTYFNTQTIHLLTWLTKHRCFFSIYIKHLASQLFIVFLLSAPNQSNTWQSFAIKSDVNKRANACIEILRQRNIKKATQYWPQTVDIGLWRIWSLGDHLEQCLFIKFVNSVCCGFLSIRVRLRVNWQGVFALTVMANIQRTLHSRSCSLYTPHLQFFQWSCYISFHAPPGDSLPSRVVESMELFHRNTHNQLSDIGESGDPHIKVVLPQYNTQAVDFLCHRSGVLSTTILPFGVRESSQSAFDTTVIGIAIPTQSDDRHCWFYCKPTTVSLLQLF